MDIKQITLYTHPTTQGRVVLVGLIDILTYRIQDAGGDPCFNHATGERLEPTELNENPGPLRALQAVGEMYRYWLAGNEDPMLLMLRKDTPVLHELYESAQDEEQGEPYVVLVPTEADAFVFAAELYAETQRSICPDWLENGDAEALYSMTERARDSKIARDRELLLMNDERTESYQVGPAGNHYWLTRAPR